MAKGAALGTVSKLIDLGMDASHIMTVVGCMREAIAEQAALLRAQHEAKRTGVERADVAAHWHTLTYPTRAEIRPGALVSLDNEGYAVAASRPMVTVTPSDLAEACALVESVGGAPLSISGKPTDTHPADID